MSKKEKRLSAFDENRPGGDDRNLVELDKDSNLVKLRNLHRSTIGAAMNTIRNAILTGEELVRIKSNLSHGKFIPYIESNKDFIGFDKRMASNYIRFYENRESIKEAKSIREALRMISDLNKSEKEINPVETKGEEPKIIYTRFKSGKPLNPKEKKILKEFLVGEKERILIAAKTKISEIEKDLNSI
ncbi:hypothetical protein [Leptospira terpstrae]|uniref:PF11300 domain protein n=1 Tax=Leptospira terpstrae serovar Hualin str. LT 11-33 = ATCC 700639 TaxID=1257025 RepID=N1VUG5_9LEPT|nr:hypothetical protein [Leptospira terpstrae]EMY60655.1 hypothetical protein LEP1GSC203_0350 [Leptospira terpstrae serovar Hualin str. LT 11-33 = ATCC 700639]